MAFQRFEGSGRTFSPKLSVRSTGQIGLNSGAILRFKLDSYSYVDLYFDPENHIIGVKPLQKQGDASFKLVIRQKNISLSARSFLDFYDIDYSKTTVRRATWDADEEMIVAPLEAG